MTKPPPSPVDTPPRPRRTPAPNRRPTPLAGFVAKSPLLQKCRLVAEMPLAGFNRVAGCCGTWFDAPLETRLGRTRFSPDPLRAEPSQILPA